MTEKPSESAPSVVALGHDVFAIDTQMSGYSGITASYLIRSSRPCLVETGTATSAPVIRAALDSLGIAAKDLATIVVTHIHLDHAGGVGDLASSYPSADVVVHESGAAHLADPSRLMASARRVFGDQVVDTVFGALRATRPDRLVPFGELGLVDLGDGRALEAFHSPGHARHHLGLLDSVSGDLYVGDAAGVYIPETAELRPATPPPDFDLERALESIISFAARQPQRLLFSHFGPVEAVAETLDRSAEELRLWVELVGEGRAAGLDLDHAVAMVNERTATRYAGLLADDERWGAFEHLSSTSANVEGIRRYLDRDAAGSSAAGAAPATDLDRPGGRSSRFPPN